MGNSNEPVLEGKALNKWKASKINLHLLRCHFHQRKAYFPKLLKAKQQRGRHSSVAAKPSGSQSGAKDLPGFTKHVVNTAPQITCFHLIKCRFLHKSAPLKSERRNGPWDTIFTLRHTHTHKYCFVVTVSNTEKSY